MAEKYNEKKWLAFLKANESPFVKSVKAYEKRSGRKLFPTIPKRRRY